MRFQFDDVSVGESKSRAWPQSHGESNCHNRRRLPKNFKLKEPSTPTLIAEFEIPSCNFGNFGDLGNSLLPISDDPNFLQPLRHQFSCVFFKPALSIKCLRRSILSADLKPHRLDAGLFR